MIPTRAQANEILSLWKSGAKLYPPHTITLALYVCGDLDIWSHGDDAESPLE
jgi:hypothetical protein